MYFSCKHVDLLISFRAAAWMRIWQYAPVGFLFVPATMAAYRPRSAQFEEGALSVRFERSDDGSKPDDAPGRD